MIKERVGASLLGLAANLVQYLARSVDERAFERRAAEVKADKNGVVCLAGSHKSNIRVQSRMPEAALAEYALEQELLTSYVSFSRESHHGS